MFGFFRWKRTVGQTTSFISGLLAPLGERLPNQVFGDAFVLGFLQMVSMHFVVETAKRDAAPNYLSLVFQQVMKNFVPALAPQLTDGLFAINDPSHPHHAAYMAGRRDGDTLMKSRKGLASAEEGKAALDGFQDFIRRNYLAQRA